MVGRFQTKKSQDCHHRNTHGGGKREKDTNLRKSDQWIFDCGATDTMTLTILT